MNDTFTNQERNHFVMHIYNVHYNEVRTLRKGKLDALLDHLGINSLQAFLNVEVLSIVPRTTKKNRNVQTGEEKSPDHFFYRRIWNFHHRTLITDNLL